MVSKTLITPNQAAEILGVDDSTIRRLILRNKLSGRKIGGRYLLEESKVRRYKLIYDKWSRD